MALVPALLLNEGTCSLQPVSVVAKNFLHKIVDEPLFSYAMCAPDGATSSRGRQRVSLLKSTLFAAGEIRRELAEFARSCSAPDADELRKAVGTRSHLLSGTGLWCLTDLEEVAQWLRDQVDGGESDAKAGNQCPLIIRLAKLRSACRAKV